MSIFTKIKSLFQKPKAEEVPLIWTSRGNVPQASLKYEVEWEVTADYTKFIERHRAADGVVVRESAHVRTNAGITGKGEVGTVT